MVYASKNPAWKYKATMGDISFTQNEGGVDALMKDLNGSCVVTFRLVKQYPIDK